MKKLVSLLFALALPGVAGAQHLANHLVISEVAVDVTDETSPTAEFIEIFNPTGSPVTLNGSGGSYFISDSPNEYFKVVDPANSAGVLLTVNSDSILQFPAGAVIPPFGTVVVTDDAAAFLAEFYGGSAAAFRNQPGSPQLFEARPDTSSAVDDVPEMIFRSRYGSGTAGLSFTNGGEPAILFFWDGTSDTVKDVDVLVWGAAGATAEQPNKTGKSSDGPDADTTATSFQADAPAAVATSTSPGSNLHSLQRRHIEEVGEVATSGNGLTGHDETSENQTVSAGAWIYEKHSPGLQHIRGNGSLIDALSFLPAAAVSAADGPNGTATPADYGADGTLTELYLSTIDTDANRQVDALYLSLRGSLFAEPDATANATFFLIDVDPAGTGGVKNLLASGNQLSDTAGTLDGQITGSGFSLPSTYPGGGFDLAVGATSSDTTVDDLAGGRHWSTASGTLSDFSWQNGAVSYDPAVSTLYPARTGTSYKAEDGLEAVIPLSLLGAAAPAYVYVVAVTAADTAGAPSPNTLPESTSDAYGSTHTLDKGLCYEVATGRIVQRYVDLDGDGVGGGTPVCGPLGTNISATTGDCDDNDRVMFPGNTEVCDDKDNDCDAQTDEGLTKPTFYRDADTDTYGNPSNTQQACTAPTGYVGQANDCDDTNPAVHPGATESCNGIDDDCDGDTDDADTAVTGTTLFYADSDLDTFGDPDVSQQRCTAPSGYVSNSTDCDDTTNTIHPGATEICDGKDQNCDGSLDEGFTRTTWYKDADLDGYGATAGSVQACAAPTGYVTTGTDCDDTNAAVNPAATETCNGVDDDCDALADDADTGTVTGKTTFYRDLDADAYGSPTVSQLACSAPSGFVADNTDCNDNVASTFPGATETCNAVDDDCDTSVDEGFNLGTSCSAGQGACQTTGSVACLTDGGSDCNAVAGQPGTETCDGTDEDCDGTVDDGVKTTFYLDNDSDTYGTAATSVDACSAPATYVTSSTDCNDTDPAIKPGATETCDGVDNNCSGVADEGLTTAYYPDADNDGVGGTTAVQACTQPANHVTTTGDCNDSDSAMKPGLSEVCDGKDNDCDGAVDEGVKATFYRDSDGDGVGGSTSQQACAAPSGYVSSTGDCNDNDLAIKPGATEVCDAKDNNCDGAVDEGVKTTFYQDADADGVGGTNSQQACSAPFSYVVGTGDCNDADAQVKPGATEVCDGKDNNCDSTIDEGLKTTYYQDADSDGVGGVNTQQACTAPTGYVATSGDCDDADAANTPGGNETCDGKDNDCDGTADEDVTNTFYVDADADGVGGTTSQKACAAPAGYVATPGDCADTDAAVKPGATEICDGKDNDCDGTADESVQTTFYVDADGDGQGAQSSVSACQLPAGHAANADDCDDANPEVKKQEKEAACADKLDNDCDGFADIEDDDCSSAPIDPEPACGCSSGTSAMLTPSLLLALAFLRRRRSRAGR